MLASGMHPRQKNPVRAGTDMVSSDGGTGVFFNDMARVINISALRRTRADRG